MEAKNKGVAIRNKKLAKNRKKMTTVKPEQENLCRFVEAKEIVIERVNRHYKKTGVAIRKGLQVKNRLFLCDGSYKFLNRSSLRIQRVYNDIPEWATEQQIECFKFFKKND